MSRANVTDIVCIGAQRAMTSWLHGVLSAHPEVTSFPNFQPVTSTSKEAHYWDWNHDRGADWYRVLMRPLDEHQKSIDATPDYAFLSSAQIGECKALSPEARVIYILRDPLARAVSAIRMHTMWATKGAAAEVHRITLDKAFVERCKHARLWDHGAFVENVKRWRAHYPDLLVVNYEDLRAAPRAGAKRLAIHCGLPWDALDDAARAPIHQRADREVWQATPYPIDPDCIHFLNGALMHEREAAERQLGMVFTEGAQLLEAAQ